MPQGLIRVLEHIKFENRKQMSDCSSNIFINVKQGRRCTLILHIINFLLYRSFFTFKGTGPRQGATGLLHLSADIS